MDLNDVTINLLLLERVGKHQKLITRDVYLNIEARSIIPEGLRRWSRGDDRNNAMLKINQTVTCAIKYLPDNPGLRVYLRGAITGIENLKETYAMCSQTCARLDAILGKIREQFMQSEELSDSPLMIEE